MYGDINMTKFRTIYRQEDGFHVLLGLHQWVHCTQEVLLTSCLNSIPNMHHSVMTLFNPQHVCSMYAAVRFMMTFMMTPCGATKNFFFFFILSSCTRRSQDACFNEAACGISLHLVVEKCNNKTKQTTTKTPVSFFSFSFFSFDLTLV